MYAIKLERFEGPLDLLLKLVEKEELAITDVSLAAVTEQYLRYLDEANDLSPEELADFLVVAARLLLLKSRVLLPNLFVDEEEEQGDLTAELELYRRYVEASRGIDQAFRARRICYVRERPLRFAALSFSPPPALKAETLRRSFARVLAELETFVRPAPELITRTISLAERIKTLRALFSNRREVDFVELLTEATTRTEIIVSFLALLELVKQRHLSVAQEVGSERIVVTRIETVYAAQG